MTLIDQAIIILKKGGVVVYPTDTAYGLAVDATNEKAVRKLYRLKGRDFKKPIHVIPPSLSSAELFARISPKTKKLMDKFLPGPLTVVVPLKAKGKSWQLLSAGTKTMGIRFPNHKIALDLVKKFGKPITTTSANVAFQANCYSVAEVKKQFTKSKLKPDFYLDGGKLRKTAPSTVISLIKDAKILREGPISETQIKRAIKSK
jgi:L-threonylcarbamoyladenylate synthase